MKRCQGYRYNGKKCHTRVEGNGIYCCPKHKPLNYDDIIEECNICCNELKNEDIKILKCRHAHHRTCLDMWIKSSRDIIVSCPLCRTPIKNNKKKYIQKKL